MTTHTERIHNLYRAFCDADTEWSTELRRIFGRQAGDMRYKMQGTGEAGSILRTLNDQFCIAREAWHNAVTSTYIYK